MRRILLLLTALLLLLLPSCAASDGFSAGRPLSKDELASLADRFPPQTEPPETETETEAQTEAQTEPKYTDREPNTVYWTKGGSVYHKYRDCYHLKDSESIQSGTVLTAQMNGKERVCSECGEE